MLLRSLCAVNLHSAVTVSQQRFGRRVAPLSAARMNEVCAALRFPLGCDSNYRIRTSSPGSIDDNDVKIFSAKGIKSASRFDLARSRITAIWRAVKFC